MLYEQVKTSNKPYGTGQTRYNTVNKTKGSSVAETSSEGKSTKRCSKDGRDNKNLDFSVSIWHFEALEIMQLVIDIIS